MLGRHSIYRFPSITSTNALHKSYDSLQVCVHEDEANNVDEKMGLIGIWGADGKLRSLDKKWLTFCESVFSQLFSMLKHMGNFNYV